MKRLKKRYDLFVFLFLFLIILFLTLNLILGLNTNIYILAAYLCILVFAFCIFKVLNEWIIIQKQLFLFGQPLSQEQFLFLKSFALQPKIKIVRSLMTALSLFTQKEKEEAIVHINQAWKKIQHLSNTVSNIRLQGRVNACYLLLHYLAEEKVSNIVIDKRYDKDDQLVIQFLQHLSTCKKSEICLDDLFELESSLEQVKSVFYRQYLTLLLNRQRYVLQPQRAIEEITQLYEVSNLDDVKQQCAASLQLWERKEEI